MQLCNSNSQVEGMQREEVSLLPPLRCKAQWSTMANHYGVRKLGAHTVQKSKPWAMWFSGASNGNIDIDAEGVMSNPPIAYIDLSNMLSQRLGRQMSQMMIYEIDYIRLELLNVDDANDNDTGASFSGYLSWHSPTAHKIKALKMATKLDRLVEETDIDNDSALFSSSASYTGLRFGFNGDNQVSYQSDEAFSQLQGSEWDMQDIFEAYDISYPAAGLLKDNYMPERGNTVTDDIGVSFGYQNKTDSDDIDTYSPLSTPYELNNAKIDCLGGLLRLELTHSSVDDGLNTIIDDDYEVRITVGVKGWRKI